MADDRTSQLQQWIGRLQDGDAAAREHLLRGACERLRLLTRKMRKSYPGLSRWEETDDIWVNVMVRLDRALQTVRPRTVPDFLRLAAAQVRRECIDLVRHYFGPEGPATHHATPGADRPDSTPRADERQPHGSDDPARLAAWGEFHEQVGALPDAERELFDLLWYQGLTQPETAEVLGVSLSTLKRRWRDARVKLYESLGGELPE